jgi:hypothetical protein
MSALSVKSGTLTKRNEQLVWQRRFCAIVPSVSLSSDATRARPKGERNG